MRMTVKNNSLTVGKVEVNQISNSSLLLVGDAEVITSSSIFDTPASSLLFYPHVPLTPVASKTFFIEELEGVTEKEAVPKGPVSGASSF